MDDVSLIIAHNAAFDRRFAERLSPIFAWKQWACSMTQISWAEEGFEGSKLAYLAMRAGFFYERHRALSDCAAAVELLRLPLPRSGFPAMTRLLLRAFRETSRIWAEYSPFDRKDVLKSRGYRWNGEGTGARRCWFRDVDVDLLETELAFLRSEIYQRDVNIPVQKISAFERFSERI